MSCRTNSVVHYMETLDAVAKERYLKKLELIDGIDPYSIKPDQCTREAVDFPNLSYPDIVNYLVHSQSAYTLESLKSYKSLESYNQFVCGWVKDVRLKVINNKCVITAKVQHSQRMSATPLKPWIIAQRDGVVLAGHCDCMAGLGEVCSHVGAVLFYIDSFVKLRNSKTVTQEAAYWMLPSGVQKVEYDKIQNINFKSAKTLRKELNTSIECQSSPPKKKQVPSKKYSNLNPPTESEVAEFLRKLNNSNARPVILSLMPDYSSDYVPNHLHENFPVLLSELYDETLDFKSLSEVQVHCESIFDKLCVSEDQSKNVEAETRGQSRCKAWFNFRLGRITASRMKAVCSTSVEKPSHSLIKNICYPHSYKFSTEATRWGCQHEATALDNYISMMTLTHEDFQHFQSGLVISNLYPYIGATPDAFVSCKCCGDGIVEIKCPFCVRSQCLADSVEGEKVCLEKTDQQLQLIRKHAYYYQVQTQIFVTKKEYCDFVVWTQSDFHQERIEPDPILWESIRQKSELFFKRVILPELVFKSFSKPLAPRPDTSDYAMTSHCEQTSMVVDTNVICICRQQYDEENGEPAIGCDNQNCDYQWWHLTCAKVTTIPKGAWYCPECKKLPQFCNEG